MSPRQSPATAMELQRIGLLASLPGETLAQIAGKMLRELVPAGGAIAVEGDEDDRFYVVLSGMLAVSQAALGARRVLQPGDYFGEVAAATGVPRTASVRALTPVAVASCDKATFDELIRPLFTSD
jgi:CRP-like cAMP-binding protein